MDKLDFKIFSTAVEDQYNRMVADNGATLVRVAVDNSELWDMYLKSYPQEFNGIFRERRNYDCNCCKNFIRRVGNLISLKGDTITSIWDVKVDGYFQDVADVLSNYVKSARVDTIYATSEKIAGGLSNIDNYDSAIKWDHFYAKVPDAYIKSNSDIGTYLGEKRAHKDVLHRSLSELTLDSAETVLELINQGSLYRGSEYKYLVEQFIETKKEFDLVDQKHADSFVWQASKKLGQNGRIKNTAIGTLLSDLSDGIDLERAVASFENKVSGTNYKRTSALVTPSMIKKAQEKIRELGFESSLERRFAGKSDVDVNNVLFSANHQKSLNVFDDLIGEAGRKVGSKKLDKCESISIDKFLSDVLPNSSKLEVFLENKHKSNLMSLVAPVHPTAPNMFKWNNQFSWAYNGDVTDTIKERVKSVGGDVSGEFRVSLAWHNPDDLDLSMVLPNSSIIDYSNKSSGNGRLDIDMNAYGLSDPEFPVENIFFKHLKSMAKGKYEVRVNNFNKRSNDRIGFDLSVEINGEITTYSYDKVVVKNMYVMTLEYDGVDVCITDVSKVMRISGGAKDVGWNVKSGEFSPVSMVMNSPNYWDGSNVGNKHLFFILENCKNDEPVRGFFNEYLKPELNEIRKTIELLGSKLKAEPTDDQLSGVGFSETIRNDLIVRVTGKTQRVFKINF